MIHKSNSSKGEVLMKLISNDLMNGNKFHNYLLNWGSKYLGDRYYAEDAVQGFYLKLLKGSGGTYKYPIDESMDVAKDGPLNLWLRFSFKNHLADTHRRMKIYKRAEVDDFEELVKCLFENSREDDLENKEEYQIVLKSIQEIPPDGFKEVLSLRYLEDLKYVEISDQLNIPLGTTKSRLSAARKFMGWAG